MPIGDIDSREQFTKSVDCFGFKNVKSFDNVYAFLDFCKEHSLDETNSVTYWSNETERMFISY